MSVLKAFGWAITLLILGAPVVALTTWHMINGIGEMEQNDYVTYAVVALFCIGICTVAIWSAVNELLTAAYVDGIDVGVADAEEELMHSTQQNKPATTVVDDGSAEKPIGEE